MPVIMVNHFQAPSSPNATSFAEADEIAQRLASRKDVWGQVSVVERISYLERCIEAVMSVAESWVEAACKAKGIDPTSTLAGEEWLVGPAAVMFNLRLLIDALNAKGQPKPPKLTQRNGQAIAQVYPANLMDRLLLIGFTGEVWIEPGQPATQGKIYREQTSGSLGLVLGAGNVSSIAPMDALYKLFAENTVVLLKMNPVNEYMGPFLAEVFQSLREDGFFEVVYGGADLGSYLCQHALVDTLHITGSHHTHDAIVWGTTPEEQAERKATNQPLNPKPFTSELGCVTPILVVPGVWSKSDLAYQAHHVAEMVVHNASFDCCSAQLVVMSKQWPQRQDFLDLLLRELALCPPREAYYPGAKQRYLAFLERYPQLQAVTSGSDTIVPWTLIRDVPPRDGEYALTQEAFCGVLAEVSLETTTAGEFLEKAVEFVNETVWGNLSCTVLVDPETQSQWSIAVEAAIAQLCYGVIGINAWSAVPYSMPMFSWGAFPGNPLNDIRSGQGVVHNTYLFDHPQKSVLRAPFRISPTPLWFSRHKNLLQLGKRFTQFEAKPTWRNFFSVVMAGLKG